MIADKGDYSAWQTSCTAQLNEPPETPDGGGACAELALCGNVMQHTCDSSHGQSGSPLWDPELMLRAIITGSATDSNGETANYGLQVRALWLLVCHL